METWYEFGFTGSEGGKMGRRKGVVSSASGTPSALLGTTADRQTNRLEDCTRVAVQPHPFHSMPSACWRERNISFSTSRNPAAALR